MPVPNLLIQQGPSIGEAVRGAEVTKGIGLQNRLAEQELQMAPEKQAFDRERMQWQRQLMEWQKEDRPIQKEMGGLKLLQDLGPQLKWQNYPQYRERLIEKMGLNPEMVPDPYVMIQQALNNGMHPEAYFENWKKESLTSMDQRIKELTAQAALANALKPESLTGTAKNLEVILGRKPTLEELKAYGKDESNPYYTPVPTSGGYMIFNNRTGKMEPMIQAGKPVLPVTADPSLAGEKKGAEKRAEVTVGKESTYPKARERLVSLKRQWDVVDKTIDKALSQINPFTAGLGSWTSVIPASSAKDLANNLETIKANIGFDKLQDIRENSPTGGALGQISDLENKLLQSVQGSLDQSQSPKQLIDNLNKIKSDVRDLKIQKEFALQYDFRDIINNSQKLEKQKLSDPLGIR